MPASTETAVLEQERPALTLRQIVQFTHFERTLSAFPGAQEAGLWARLLGVPPEHYALLLQECSHEADRLGDLLLQDGAARAEVDRLRRARRGVVALGDSITADRCGWFEVIRSAAGESVAPHLRNAGGTGDTTVHALTRLQADVLQHRPAVVVIALGTNDARRHGVRPGTTLSTPEGFRERLTAIVGAAAGVRARCVLVTPPPVLPVAEEQRDGQSWTVRGVQERAEVVRELGTALQVPVADAHAAFASEPDLDALYLADGLRPGTEGQLLLARTVLPRIAEACA